MEKGKGRPLGETITNDCLFLLGLSETSNSKIHNWNPCQGEGGPKGLICASLRPKQLVMKFSSKWMDGYKIKRCWVTYTLEKENWISSDIFWPEAFFFLWAVKIKTNFDLFYSESDEDIKARILPLILFVISRPYSLGPSAPWGWGCVHLQMDSSCFRYNNPIREVTPGTQKGFRDCGGRQPLVWPRLSVYKIYVFVLTVEKP